MRNLMRPTNPPRLKKTITVKTPKSLEEYKSIVFLAREYYDAFRHDKDLPKKPLPHLSVLFDATTVVDAYMKEINKGVALKLYNAVLPVDKLISVWLFAKERDLNLSIGKHQVFILKNY